MTSTRFHFFSLLKYENRNCQKAEPPLTAPTMWYIFIEMNHLIDYLLIHKRAVNGKY